MVVDYFMKKKVVDSFSFFLDQIDESDLSFPKKKMNQYNKTEVSIPAYQL